MCRESDNELNTNIYTRFQKKVCTFSAIFHCPLCLMSTFPSSSKNSDSSVMMTKVKPRLITAVAPKGNAVVPNANGQPDDVLKALVPHRASLAELVAGLA